MPLCDGRPNCPCPEKKNDNSVKLSQGDLMLCAACDAYRFPPKNTSSIALKNGVSTQPKSVDHDNVKVSNPVDKGAILVAEKIF